MWLQITPYINRLIDWLNEYNFLSHNAVILLSCTDECVTDSDCGSHGKCLNITDFSYPQKQCFCQPGYFGFKCEKGNIVVKVCRELKMIGKVFVLFKINSSPSRAILVLKLILVLVFILFWGNNFYSYIVLVQPKSIVLVFILFSCTDFRFYIISFFDCAEFLYYWMSGVICSKKTQTSCQ